MAGLQDGHALPPHRVLRLFGQRRAGGGGTPVGRCVIDPPSGVFQAQIWSFIIILALDLVIIFISAVLV